MTQILVYGIAASLFVAFLVSVVAALIDWPPAFYDVVECVTICAAAIGVLVATYFTILGLAAALL